MMALVALLLSWPWQFAMMAIALMISGKQDGIVACQCIPGTHIRRSEGCNDGDCSDGVEPGTAVSAFLARRHDEIGRAANDGGVVMGSRKPADGCRCVHGAAAANPGCNDMAVVVIGSKPGTAVNVVPARPR